MKKLTQQGKRRMFTAKKTTLQQVQPGKAN